MSDNPDDFDDRATRTHRTWPATDSGRRKGTPLVERSDRARQTQELRDAASEQQRKLRARQGRIQTTPYGTVIESQPRRRDDQITEEHEVFDREPTIEERAIAERSKRDSSDPLTVMDGGKLLKHIEKLIAHRLEESSKRERTATADGIAKIEKLIATPPHQAVLDLQAAVKAILVELSGEGKEPGLRETVKGFTRWRSAINRVLSFFAPVALAGLIAALGAIWNRSSLETELRMTIRQLSEQIGALNQELGRYRQLVFPTPKEP